MQHAEQHLLIRQSWAAAMADQRALAQLFYRKLFERAPETERLFETDMDAQGRKLMATLTFVVDALDNPEALLPAAGDLARRHVGYDVRAEHYPPVGDALVAALSDLLGARFDAQTKAAWEATYGALSQHMIQAAYGTGAAK